MRARWHRRRRGSRAVLLGAVALAALPGAGAARTNFIETAQAALLRSTEAVDRDDCVVALKQINPVMSDGEFSTLPEQGRAAILQVASYCELETKQYAKALTHARTITTYLSPPAEAWRLRFGLEVQDGQYAAAVTTLDAIQKQAPAVIGNLDKDWIWSLFRKLKADEKLATSRSLFLAVVSRPGFAPEAEELNFEWLQLEYARDLAAAGDKTGAARVIGKLRKADALYDASLDFDPAIRSAVGANFDLRAAYEREIEMLYQMSALRPGLLNLVLETARAQRMIGQPEAALATLEAARPYGILSKQFSDRAERLNWWWDGMGRTYTQLGRYDDAVAAFTSAIEGGESGMPNVSQTINLGYVHNYFGHPEATLTLLAPFENNANAASPYGMMEFHLARGCAAQAAGKPDITARDLAFAKAHDTDHPEALSDLLMCMGDLDSAAASVVARLDDPKRRLNALKQLSDYAPQPASAPVSPLDASLQKLRERPDVKAAILRAGGARRFNVQAPDL